MAWNCASRAGVRRPMPRERSAASPDAASSSKNTSRPRATAASAASRSPSMDWRGQGHSSRQLPDPRKGHVASFAEYEIDAETFMRLVVLPECPPPYFALAHSMGGAVPAARRACRPALVRAHGPDRAVDRSAWEPRSAWPLRLLVRTLRLAGLGGSYVPGSNVDRTRAKGFPGQSADLRSRAPCSQCRCCRAGPGARHRRADGGMVRCRV